MHNRSFISTDDLSRGNPAAADGNGPARIQAREILSVFAIEKNNRLVFLQRSA
jgi:hypothetical protein